MIRPFFYLALMIAFSAAANAELETIDHIIPPGYEPSEAQDEQGLWMELKDYELRLNKSALLVRDPELTNYVKGIVCRVAGDYCNDIRVYLIRNPGFNASMTATGMMQIWTGLLVRSTSSDEIAAVVGHEIAHYTRMHTLKRFRRLKSSAAAGGLIDIGISIFTGTSVPIAQSLASMNALAFSRDQEQEADLLGARLLHEASMDPHAAYRVWQNIIAEEESAAVKRRSVSVFAQTHPDDQSRVDVTREWVIAKYGPPDNIEVADDALVTIMNNHYYFLMEDQIDTNRFGRTKELLERHSAMGVEPGTIYYFYGEMFRQRGADGDRDLAMSAYRHSIETGNAPADAYRNLGFLYLKEKDIEGAKKYFTIFLEQEPDATDRAMIEFYLDKG